MEEKLWSRQKVCATLGISMRTLCRRLEILNIKEVERLLPNGVTKKQIKDIDLQKLKAFEMKNGSKVVKSETKDLIPYAVQISLIETRLALQEKEKLYQQLNESYNQLRKDYEQAIERNDNVFSAYMELDAKYQALLEAAATKRKGFWSRFFKG